MFSHIKYGARQGLGQRLVAVGSVIVLNAVFGILGGMGFYRGGWLVVAVTFSSLAMAALFIVNIIADFESMRSLFSSPGGYYVHLVPVSGGRILFSRVVPIVALDLGGLAVATGGVVLQSLILAEFAFNDYNVSFAPIAWMCVIILVNYLLLTMQIFFGCAVAKSQFYRLRGRAFLGFLVVLAVMYVCNIANLALAAVAPVERYGLFFNISLSTGFNAGMMLYLLLEVVKSALLFVATAHLIERKINL